MEDDFIGAARIGPYIADEAVAARILAEVDAVQEPVFVFAVTMENHGPWKPGRLDGITEPLDQYLHHVAHTGRAVETLIEGSGKARCDPVRLWRSRPIPADLHARLRRYSYRLRDLRLRSVQGNAAAHRYERRRTRSFPPVPHRGALGRRGRIGYRLTIVLTRT